MSCLDVEKIWVGEKVKPFLRKFLGFETKPESRESVSVRFKIREVGYRVKSEAFQCDTSVLL